MKPTRLIPHSKWPFECWRGGRSWRRQPLARAGHAAKADVSMRHFYFRNSFCALSPMITEATRSSLCEQP